MLEIKKKKKKKLVEVQNTPNLNHRELCPVDVPSWFQLSGLCLVFFWCSEIPRFRSLESSFLPYHSNELNKGWSSMPASPR